MIGTSHAGTASPSSTLSRRSRRSANRALPYGGSRSSVMARRASSKAFPASRLARSSEECGQTAVQPNFQEVDRSGVAAFDAVGQSIPLGPRLPAGLEPLVNLARLLARQVARGWLAEGPVSSRMTPGSQAEENSGTWGTSSSSASTPIPPGASDPSQGPLPIGIPLSGRPKRRHGTEG
jgi:hypothetical protein